MVAAAGAIAASAILHSENGPVAQAVLHGKNPSTLVLDVAFVAFVVGSDLVRRRTGRAGVCYRARRCFSPGWRSIP